MIFPLADLHLVERLRPGAPVLGHASVATTEKHYAQFSPKHSARKVLKILEGGLKKVKKRTA